MKVVTLHLEDDEADSLQQFADVQADGDLSRFITTALRYQFFPLRFMAEKEAQAVLTE